MPSLNKDQQPEVLIVGAGPTGLLAAVSLARFKIPFRIVEKRLTTTKLSKALALQTRSIEIYEQILGGPDSTGFKKVIAGSQVVEQVSMFKEGYKQVDINVSTAFPDDSLSQYAKLYILEQSKNESLLYERLKELGHDVEWGRELCELEDKADQATVYTKIKNSNAKLNWDLENIKSDAKTSSSKDKDETARHDEADDKSPSQVSDWQYEYEEIRPRFVIGCDGGRSPVRHFLGQKFVGDTYESLFYVVDTFLQCDDIAGNAVTANLFDGGFSAFFPIGAEEEHKKDHALTDKDKRFRMIGNLPDELAQQLRDKRTLRHQRSMDEGMPHPDEPELNPNDPGMRKKVWDSYNKDDEETKQVTFEDVKNAINQHWKGGKSGKGELKLGKALWFSVYRLHHRYVEQFQVKRVFLAGDAAHVHSPAGGQGMNTGLQDAYNLTWKLAWELRYGKLKQNENNSNNNKQQHSDLHHTQLVKSYHAERQPNAMKLVSTTDAAFKFVNGKDRFSTFMKLNVIPYVAKFASHFEFARQQMFGTVSQCWLNYRGNSLLNSSGQLSQSVTGSSSDQQLSCDSNGSLVTCLHVQPGDRFPFFRKVRVTQWKTEEQKVQTKNAESIFHLLDGLSLQLVVFNGSNSSPISEKQLEETAMGVFGDIAGGSKDRKDGSVLPANIVVLETNPQHADSGNVRTLKIQKPGFSSGAAFYIYVVRPDGYVGATFAAGGGSGTVAGGVDLKQALKYVKNYYAGVVMGVEV